MVFRVFLFILLTSCGPHSSTKHARSQSPAPPLAIAVYIPGLIQGSPIYELLDAGVRKACEEKSIPVKTIEGGFNQARWQEQLLVLSSKQEYALIVTANTAMPQLCRKSSLAFPRQKFLILDAWDSGNPSIATLYYNHRELAYLHGVLTALLAKQSKQKPYLGFIVGQEYPVIHRMILPGLKEGLASITPDGRVELRVVGNWYDVAKAEQLAQNLIGLGSTVLLPIAGGSGQGVITAAKRTGIPIIWNNTPDQSTLESQTLIGYGKIHHDKAAAELTQDFLEDKLSFGQPKIVGFKEGYIDYSVEGPLFQNSMETQEKKIFVKLINDLRSGRKKIDPTLP